MRIEYLSLFPDAQEVIIRAAAENAVEPEALAEWIWRVSNDEVMTMLLYRSNAKASLEEIKNITETCLKVLSLDDGREAVCNQHVPEAIQTLMNHARKYVDNVAGEVQS